MHFGICFFLIYFKLVWYTVEPLLRGRPDERPPLLERPLDNANLNIHILISTPDERPPLLKDHCSDAKGVASQEGFHCTANRKHLEVLLLCIYFFDRQHSF